MVAFGMTGVDKRGDALVHQATRIMTSSDAVVKQVGLQCENPGSAKQHRHVHLIQVRARHAQVYLRMFSERLREGISAQKRLDELGLRARPIMTLEQMQKADSRSGGSDCPCEALH